MTKFKEKDIVLVQSNCCKEMPKIHVRLLKRIESKSLKGQKMNWPSPAGWEAELFYSAEVDVLRKKWHIPFKFPNDVNTFIYEEEIVEKVKNKKNNYLI
jgi:hypothetical protein